MHKLIPPYCLNIHFEGFPKVNIQRTDFFPIRHRAFKYVLKLLTRDPASQWYSVAQCAAKHTQTVQRQLCCWKASTYGEDCADVHFHAQLLHRYSQRTIFQKQCWKITMKRKQFCRIAIAIFFFIRLFTDTHQSYILATIVSHLLYKPSTKKYFIGFSFFLLHNDSPNVDNIISIMGMRPVENKVPL